jgi:hypothetical protein
MEFFEHELPNQRKTLLGGGVLAGSVGGGNEGKEVTSFRLAMYKANLVPILKVRVKKQRAAGG